MIGDSRDLQTRKRQVLQCQLLGLFEALDSAAPFMENPKDILLMDLDNEGRWKVDAEAQVQKVNNSAPYSSIKTSLTS